MDRQQQIEILLDHYEHPRYRYGQEDADVIIPGGNPGCGDVITIYLTVDSDGNRISEASYEGEGCTISQAAASIIMELVNEEHWTLDDIVAADYTMMVDLLGQESVQTRPRCATLALGTLKAAVKKYRRDQMLGDAGSSDDLDEGTLGIVTGQAAEEQRGQGVPHD